MFLNHITICYYCEIISINCYTKNVLFYAMHCSIPFETSNSIASAKLIYLLLKFSLTFLIHEISFCKSYCCRRRKHIQINAVQIRRQLNHMMSIQSLIIISNRLTFIIYYIIKMIHLN